MTSARWAIVAIALASPTQLAAQDAPACDAAVRESTTRRLFEQLRAIDAADGCALHAVNTARDHIDVVYAARGAPLAPLTIAPARCFDPASGADTLEVRVPSELERACPITLRQARAVVTTMSPSEFAPAPDVAPFTRSPGSVSPGRALISWIAAGVILALVLFVTIRSLRTPP
jgi:hypothetical protein